MAVTAIHPGEHLAEEFKAISAAELARKLDVPTDRITQILNGTRRVQESSTPAQSLGVKCTSFHWHISDLFTPIGAIHEPEPSRYREPRAKIQATRACLRRGRQESLPSLEIDIPLNY